MAYWVVIVAVLRAACLLCEDTGIKLEQEVRKSFYAASAHTVSLSFLCLSCQAKDWKHGMESETGLTGCRRHSPATRSKLYIEKKRWWHTGLQS